MRSRTTQRDKILALLQSRANQWVALFEILPLAAQYGARIFELRGAGHRIENKTEHRNGQVHSWFRLVEPDQARLFPQERLAEQSISGRHL